MPPLPSPPDPVPPPGPARHNQVGPDQAGPDHGRAHPAAGQRDPGLAAERTQLAWARTAIAFGALGVLIARRDLAVGLIVLACLPGMWILARVTGHPGATARPGRLLLVTVVVTGVALVAAAVALFGHSPGSLRDVLPHLG